MRRVSAPPASGEERIIARFFSPLAHHPGAFGLTDDAAILSTPPASDVVLTTDAIIAGVHFFPDDPPDAVARKALRVNLSDLAAKGAEAAGFLLSLALPAGVDEDWLGAFAGGLRSDSEHFRCPLLGGDTDRTPGPVTIAIAAFGLLPRGAFVRRSGAKVGDAVVITGTIGDAALGLRMRREGDAARRWGLDPAMRDHLERRYLVPEPRTALALALRMQASAAMDVSDGLVGDLEKLCRTSRVAAAIEVARVPLSAAASAAAAAEPSLIETVLTGGDDYEILCTMAPGQVAAFRAAAAAAGIAATEIGRIAAGEGAQFLDRDGRALTFVDGAYSHF